MNDETAENIIEEAKNLYRSRRSKGLLCDYNDYERFKAKLHYAGIYGYENQISDALHV